MRLITIFCMIFFISCVRQDDQTQLYTLQCSDEPEVILWYLTGDSKSVEISKDIEKILYADIIYVLEENKKE